MTVVLLAQAIQAHRNGERVPTQQVDITCRQPRRILS